MKITKQHLVGGALPVALAVVALVGYSIGRARAAGIPASMPMTYSGVLTDATGAPLSGSKNIQISIFDMASAGTLQCTVGPTAISLVNGGFQVALPDACTTAVHAKPDLWLEVFADGASLGRTKLGAVPYAVEADHAKSADSATAATNATNATNAQVAQLASAVSATVGSTLAGGAPPAGTKFIWQGATFVGTSDATGHLAIPFASAFPNGLVSVAVTNSFAQGAGVSGIQDNESLSGFTVIMGANQLVRINWLALGW